MRKLIKATLVSLNGVVGSPEEWALPYVPPVQPQALAELTLVLALVPTGSRGCSRIT